jgi:hypothetical protein
MIFKSIERNYTPFDKGPITEASDFLFGLICIDPVIFGEKKITE